MNIKTIIVIAVVVVVVAVLALSIFGIIPLTIPGLSSLINVKVLPPNGYIYVIGSYPNVPTLVNDVLSGSLIRGLSSYEGVGSLSSNAINAILSLVKGNNTYVIKVGNSSAPVWLIEFLDPVCPYCTIFDVLNFSKIAPLIYSGKVYYVAIYFPTHALGYYQAYVQNSNVNGSQVFLLAFNDSVALWMQWKCVNDVNSSQTLSVINETYVNNFIFIVNYLESNNQAYIIYYPIYSYLLLNKTIPACRITLTPESALNITNSALNQVNQLVPLLIPKNLQNSIGTPMFIIMRNPT